MLTVEITTESLRLLAVFAGLFAFGFGYNILVAWLEQKHYTEGYLSLIVALGVFLTLCGVAFLDWRAALLSLCGFIASGTPMIAGSLHRYVIARKYLQEAIARKHLQETADHESSEVR